MENNLSISESVTKRTMQLLRKLRGDRSVRSFSKQNNINYGTWTNWEKGLSTPTLESCKQIADVLGVNILELIEYLLEGDIRHQNPESIVKNILRQAQYLSEKDKINLGTYLIRNAGTGRELPPEANLTRFVMLDGDLGLTRKTGSPN